jgi:imidazolonepropionase-like amidohydrolase
MLIKDRSSLRVTLGAEPSQGNMAIRGGVPDSFYFRRPTTRMGVIWSLRKAFYDALAYREQRTLPGPDGKPLALPDDPAFQTLLEAVDKKLAVRTTARAEQDIRTALRIANEFGYETMLEEPVEAWRVVDLIAQSKAKVLFGAPSLRTSQHAARDGADGRDATLAALAKAKVPFAITTAGGGENLLREALFAVRSGLSSTDALAAVTLAPAQILGVQDRVGSIAAGKDADLVVFSGDPFDPTTKIETVYINGKEVK